jgi:hypothetical protein
MLSLPPADEGERQSEEPMGHATSLRRHHRRRARQRPGDTPGLGLRALSRQTAAPVCAAAGGHFDLRRAIDRGEGALIGKASGPPVKITTFVIERGPAATGATQCGLTFLFAQFTS